MNTTKHYIFHANWCPHCVTLMNTLHNMKQVEKIDDNRIIIGGSEVRLVEQQEMETETVKKILGGYVVRGFPTILSISNNNIEEYNGLRDENSLLEHFKEKPNNKKKKKKNKTTRIPMRLRKLKGGAKKRRKTKKNGLFSFLF